MSGKFRLQNLNQLYTRRKALNVGSKRRTNEVKYSGVIGIDSKRQESGLGESCHYGNMFGKVFIE